MSVHILIVSDRSLQNSTSRRYSSTMFSSCWSAAQSRVSRRRRRRPGACAAHGEVSSLRAFAWAAWRRRRWESAPSIRAQLLIYYTKLLLRGQRSRLSSPQPAGKLGLQAVQAQATQLQSRALPHLIGNGDRGVTLVPRGCEQLCAARHQLSAAGQPASQPPCSLLRQGYTGGGMGGGTHQGCSSHWKASSLEWPP